MRKAERAIDLLDELLFKNDQHMLIITNIENNFKRLYEIKVLKNKGYNVSNIASNTNYLLLFVKINKSK